MGVDVRGHMESAFAADFGAVRLHTDSEANELNRALAARAFAIGGDIFFREGEYQPATDAGRELLAHELTHVVQQNPDVRYKLFVGDAGDPHEQEADEMARAVARSPIRRSIVRQCACGGSRGSVAEEAGIGCKDEGLK
jgi:ribonuclease HI